MTPKFINALADRFLSWKLPQDFAPDCHISFKLPDPVLNPNPSWPVGTNLLTADQARQMFEDVIGKLTEDADNWRMAQMLGLLPADAMARIARARGERPAEGRSVTSEVADRCENCGLREQARAAGQSCCYNADFTARFKAADGSEVPSNG